MDTLWYEITPGSMGAVAVAIDLFGVQAVDPGGWMTPIWVNVTPSEADAAKSLLADQGLEIREALSCRLRRR